MSDQYVAIIPTATEKDQWFRRTLFGLAAQTIPPTKVVVGYDIKPHEDVFLPILEYGIPIETVQFHFEDEWKHQHEIINRLVTEHTNLDDVLLIMDDDYWMRPRSFMAKLLQEFLPHSLTFVTHYENFEGYVPLDPPKKDAQWAYYFEDDRKGQVHSTLEKDGYHNPFCGHPKLITSGDFQEIGGFDTESFRHYWWCDTDLYLKVKQCLRLIPVKLNREELPIHLNHPRHKLFTFTETNRKVFDKRYPEHQSKWR